LRTIAELCGQISENSSNGTGAKKETAAQKKAREKAEQEAAAAQAVAAMGLPAPALPSALPALPAASAPAPTQLTLAPALPLPPVAGVAATATAPVATLPALVAPPTVPALPSLPAPTPTITEEMLVHTVQAVMQGIAARLQKPQDAPEVKAYIVPAIQKHGGTELANVPQANWGALCDDLKAILA